MYWASLFETRRRDTAISWSLYIITGDNRLGGCLIRPKTLCFNSLTGMLWSSRRKCTFKSSYSPTDVSNWNIELRRTPNLRKALIRLFVSSCVCLRYVKSVKWDRAEELKFVVFSSFSSRHRLNRDETKWYARICSLLLGRLASSMISKHVPVINYEWLIPRTKLVNTSYQSLRFSDLDVVDCSSRCWGVSILNAKKEAMNVNAADVIKATMI